MEINVCCNSNSSTPCTEITGGSAICKTITTRYDVAGQIRTPHEMAACRAACFEEAEGDAAFIATALGDIAHAKGMPQVAPDAGLSRESLDKALSHRRPGSIARKEYLEMIDLPYSLIIEATEEPDYFGFYSPDLEGFTGVGHSVEDCIYKAKWGIREHVALLMEQGLPVPRSTLNPKSS
jgi:probable addiction module antidote protein